MPNAGRSFFVHAGLVGALGLLAGACQTSDSPGLEIGTQLPSLLREARLQNAPVDAEPPRKGWVIYFFSPRSSAAEENSARVEALADSLSPDWVLLAVPVEEEALSAFLDRLQVTVPILTQIPRTALGPFQVTADPRTYILDMEWKLVAVLDGVYRDEIAEQLVRHLNVSKANLAGAKASAGTSPSNHQSRPGDCLDSNQDPYSPDAKAEVLGQLFRCASGGLWIPIS